jgi:hypothetical protein
MHALGFDVLGVRRSGRVVGYLEAETASAGNVADHVRNFHASELVSDSTPIVEVLDALRTRPRIFVISGNHVFGIITRADLQKPAVRIAVFGLVSLFEAQLSRLVQDTYPKGEWQNRLSETRLEAAQRIYKERVARNEEIDLVDCVQLADKRDLLLRADLSQEVLRFPSKSAAKRFFSELEKLRNKLAHSQDLVTGSSWDTLIPLIEELDLLVERIESSYPDSPA